MTELTKAEKLARAMDNVRSGGRDFNSQLAAQVSQELRAQAERIKELEAGLARHREDRPFVIGWNDGFEHGVKEAAHVCKPTDFNDSDEVRVWKYVKHRILALIEGATND